MVGGILFEHGHRLVAAAVSTLVGLELGALLFLLKGRKTVKVLAAAAFVAILLQALLGGLTVLFLLPPAISSAHAALAEIVFALTAVVALMCSKTWKEISKREISSKVDAPQADLPRTEAAARPPSYSFEEDLRASSKGEEARSAFRWVVAATAAIYLQILVGAVMRHTGAGLASRTSRRPSAPSSLLSQNLSPPACPSTSPTASEPPPSSSSSFSPRIPFRAPPAFPDRRRRVGRPRLPAGLPGGLVDLVREGGPAHRRPPRRGRPLLGDGRPRLGRARGRVFG